MEAGDCRGPGPSRAVAPQMMMMIAIGSPISSIIAKIFLQYYENMFIKHLLESRSITHCTRYVDIFIIRI
jgi:hypothetical protein